MRSPLSTTRRRAFTLIELLTVVAIMLILAALLLPALQSAYGKGRRVMCASNLKQIGTAFHLWAHDHNDLFPMQVPLTNGGTRELALATALSPDVSSTFRHFQALSNQLEVAKLMACPADKQRFPATNFASLRNENVSYWINPAAAFGSSDSPVAGDRNVRTSGRIEWTFLQFSSSDAVEFSAELHGHRGNVLFGDAHVDLFDSRLLRAALSSGSNTEIVLSLPRPDMAVPPAQVEATAAGPNTAAPGADGSSRGNRGGSSSAGAAQGISGSSAPASSQTSNRAPSASVGALGSGSRGPATELVIVTRLDGTLATSSIPRQATNAAVSRASAENTESESTNPIIQFLHWLIRASTGGTYWLLLLLLAALLAFELARRRARRKRRGAGE